MPKIEEWLPLDIASHQFGYTHKESLTRRIRQLRQEGKVKDLGRPPASYRTQTQPQKPYLVVMWPNPKTALLRSDASKKLLNSSRGKRAEKMRKFKKRKRK